MKDYKHLGLEKGFKRGLAAQPRNFQSEFDQDVKMEKGAYANPTQIQKGQTDFTMGGIVNFKDASGSTILTYSPSTGAITISNNVDQTGTLAVTGDITLNGVALATGASSLEGAITITHAGSSGGYNVMFGNDTGNYQNLSDSEFLFNPDDYPGANFYLEVVGRAGAFGDPLRTTIVNFYNVTDGGSVASSLASTTQTSAADGDSPGALVRFRSGTISFPSGDKEYILQFKTDTAGRYADVASAKLIIAYS